MSNNPSKARIRRAKQRRKKDVSHAKKQHDSEGKPTIQVKSQPEFDKYIEDPQPVMVDFWAPWCGPCKAMSPIYEKVAQQFKGQVRFLKVNTEDVPELAAAFGIRSIPSVIALHGDQVVGSNVGLTAEATLTKMAQRALDKSQGVTLTSRIKRIFGKGDDAPVELHQG